MQGVMRDELIAYVNSLDLALQTMYRHLDRMELTLRHDTLDESYQVVADLLSVFEQRAKKKRTKPCPTCGGNGEFATGPNDISDVENCPTCDGEGVVA